jgi:predicted nucleic acid-binding Zn ribbon protein
MLSIIISAIGLLSFPCGTLISACLLYLFFSHKGEMVFSDRYEEIIQGTPHIKYKTLIIVWIFLLILIGVILAAIIATEVAVR